MMPSELGSSIGRFGLIAAGGYAFGPIGAAAGALLGGFLFGSSGPKIEGPRLGDLDVSSSTYGGVIPLGFGVQKVAGAIIWATDIDEDKNTRKEGGSLFGGGQKIVDTGISRTSRSPSARHRLDHLRLFLGVVGEIPMAKKLEDRQRGDHVEQSICDGDVEPLRTAGQEADNCK